MTKPTIEPLKMTTRLPPEEEVRRRRAYEAALSDREAARSLGMRSGGFADWRKSRGLPPKMNQSMGRPVEPIREIVYRVALLLTRSDAEAAKVLNISVANITGWRRRRGMHSKYEGRVPR